MLTRIYSNNGPLTTVKFKLLCFIVRKMEKQVTISLLAVTFTFIVLLFWQCVSKCFFMLKFGQELDSHLEIWKFVDGNFALSKIGLVLNSAINSFIYCCCGSNFRKELKNMFSLFFTSCKRRNIDEYTGSTTKNSAIPTGHSNGTSVTMC